jgi:hypothetical protein
MLNMQLTNDPCVSSASLIQFCEQVFTHLTLAPPHTHEKLSFPFTSGCLEVSRTKHRLSVIYTYTSTVLRTEQERTDLGEF